MAIINPPWRLDPLQMIVNVNWGSDYLFFVRFFWSDTVVFHQDPEFNFFNSISSTSVDITSDAPSGSLIYDNLITNVNVVSPPTLTYNRFIKTFVFNVSSAGLIEHPNGFGFSLTEQGDDTADFLWSTNAAGQTQTLTGLTYFGPGAAPVAGTGPWPSMLISLYSKDKYFLDPSNPLNPIQPKHLDDNPGPSAQTAFLTSLGTIGTTPSTDSKYYALPTKTAITGGAYSVSGLFRDGSLVLNVEMLPVTESNPVQYLPVIWPSEPVVRNVDYVFGFPLTNVGDYLLPNPPPPYAFGLYAVNPDPSAAGTGLYQCGGPPVSGNAYTGTYPAQP